MFSISQKNILRFAAPLFLAGICIFCYGLLINQHGYYWDDWAKLLVNRLYGPDGYWQYYAEDRPLSAWTHIVLNSILGYSPLNWQVFVLLSRWLAACLLFQLLSDIKISTFKTNLLASAIFLVYPVFTQYPISVTFHQQYIQYIFLFISFIAMVRSIKDPKHRVLLVIISLIFSAAQLTITEYFMPLEALRLIILWILIAPDYEKIQSKILAVAKGFTPYFLFDIFYLVYRLMMIRLPGEDPYKPELLYSLISEPFSTLRHLVILALVETYQILLGSWQGVIDLGISQIPRSLRVPDPVIGSWLVVIGIFIFVSIFFTIAWKLKVFQPLSDHPVNWGLLVMGLVAILLGAAPAWISGRQILDDYHSNRYALPAIMGASLVWAFMISQITRNPKIFTFLSAAVLALFSGYQYLIGTEYANIWKNQTDFYWQLSWRAPSIEKGTALIFETEFFPNQGLFSTSSAINFLYPQPENPEKLSYWAYILRPEMAENFNQGKNVNLHTQFRSLLFDGSLSQSIMVYYDPGRANCLRILTQDDINNPDLFLHTRQSLMVSNLGLISDKPPEEGYPPKDILGKEPDHGFCYLYQKAALAQQDAKWDDIVDYGNMILAAGNYPSDPWVKTPHEWLPFIRGYAQKGMWQNAGELMVASNQINTARYQDYLCGFWDQLVTSTPPSKTKTDTINQVNQNIGCLP